MILPVSEARFLSEYWQQKPLFCPGAIADFQSPLTPEHLVGLAMEPEAESRLVWQSHGAWQQQSGPFQESDFQKDAPWTLLVQRVDHWFSEVAALKSILPALPQWRFDDVMVSYATDEAGVGPHFDRYDVFLLQGDGQREWRLGPHCDERTPQLSENGLNLIPPFEPEHTFTLEAGDVLYVPPGIAHWGVARGPCMTYSLGFRAPSVADLLARRVDHVLERLSESALLEDGHTATLSARPGEITAAHLANAKDAMHNAIDALDDQRWLGEVVTETLGSDWDDEHPHGALHEQGPVKLHTEAKLAWTEQKHQVDLFLNGTHHRLSLSELPHVITLCSGKSVNRALLEHEAEALYRVLLEYGALVPEEDSENRSMLDH